MSKDKIDSFNGRYRFLSNFAPAKVIYDGLEYSSTEHAYQAAKTLDASERKKIRDADKPGLAKKLGRKVTMRRDWENIKFDVMLELLRQKFKIPDLKQALLNTGDMYLEEGNTWGDIVWGTVDGQGQNNLGRLLMQVRKELK